MRGQVSVGFHIFYLTSSPEDESNSYKFFEQALDV